MHELERFVILIASSGRFMGVGSVRMMTTRSMHELTSWYLDRAIYTKESCDPSHAIISQVFFSITKVV